MGRTPSNFFLFKRASRWPKQKFPTKKRKCLRTEKKGEEKKTCLRVRPRPFSLGQFRRSRADLDHPAVGGSHFETHKLIPFRFEACLKAAYWRFVFCRCRAPWVNSNSQEQVNPKTRRKGKRHLRCHERIQTARDRTTLGPEEKEKKKKQEKKKLFKKKENPCSCTYLRVSRLAGGKA